MHVIYNQLAIQFLYNYSETITETPIFSAEEEKKFQTRLDNGYDLKTDPQYNLWLSIHGTNGHTDDAKKDLITTVTCHIEKNNKCNDYVHVYSLQAY